MDHRSDSEVIAAVLDGDDDAFAVLFRRYRDAYTRYAVRMVGNRMDADEVLQSAWMRAYRALGQCRDRGRFGAWMYQIVMNECRTFATRRARRDRRFAGEEALADQHAPPAQPGDGAAVGEEVQRALGELDVQQREAFVLKYVEELSYDEMAELTGAGVSALKMRVKRACARLRELLDESHLQGVEHDGP